ncbi:MAG: leucine-rich repeat protein [Clostridia bacterium]|nr:leucine-rich repeat protein [Clostridia bacterium]
MKCRRFLAMVLTFVCLAALLPAAAEAPENPGYRLEDGVLYINEGAQALGYVPDEIDLGGLVHSFAIDNYLNDSWDMPYDMRELREVVLPESLVYLGESVFYGITAERFAVPGGITHIGDRTFVESYVRYIHFHAGVTGYSRYSFCGCEGVEAFTVEEGNPALKAVDGVLFSADGKTLLRYPPLKKQEHYDVPFGVTAIAPYAFDNCSLRSISLPMGVSSIGWSAFSDSLWLETVAVPLTLRTLEPFAFSNCINLSSLPLPAGVQVVCDPDTLAERNSYGEEWLPEPYVCYNTPKLTGYDQWDLRKLKGTEPMEEPEETQQLNCPGILNPENARDFVNIYQSPSKNSKVLGSFACGSTVQVMGWQDGWCNVWYLRDEDEGSTDGWVEESQLLPVPTGEPMFTYTSIAPVSSKVRSLNNGPCVLPYNRPGNKLPQDTPLYFIQMQGQWVNAMIEDAEFGYGYLYFYPSDLTYTRRDNGDGYRYGIVISDDPRDRLNLRAEPSTNSERLGKYFSGTQVRILGEEGDWYHVWLDFKEGWMMKEFIREVPVDAASSTAQ